MKNETKDAQTPQPSDANYQSPVLPTDSVSSTVSPNQNNPAVVPAGNDDNSPRKRRPRIRIIAVGVILVLAVVIILLTSVFTHLNSEGKAAETVSDNFIQDLANNNASAAYQLTDSTFRQNNSEAKLDVVIRTAHKNIEGKPVRKNFGINDFNGKTTATVNYSTNGPGGSGITSITLRKNDGQWQVDGVQFPTFALKGYTIQ
ncbi:MAG TPA: hypothetical protein VHB72_02630 [Candidatus Saccharimonadales bacterium]|nr:hypothetical protein [Candidatus Saccharimonadales bacterium]